MAEKRRILIVDDNPQYRAAVARNLTLAGYRVIEAEDSDDGMDKIRAESPQVVITDLDMRTHDEGLNFIREVKRSHPQTPIIMISAVGSFDEGALARQYGAMFVLSKSRIDEEINTLYQRLDAIYNHFEKMRSLRDRLEEALQKEGEVRDSLRAELGRMMENQDLDAGLKSEAYEMLDRLDSLENRSAGLMKELDADAVLASIKNELPEASALDGETRTMLSIAESLYASPSAHTLSVARNISFSYSFAVENEVKLRLGRKVNRLLASDNIRQLAHQIYDAKLGNLDIFFNQYLIRTVHQMNLELNSDITRQVLERIIQHESKYKPDGLKALGVILFCWGRNHDFTNRKGKISIHNPLGVKGLADGKTTELASRLILLQHLRNPFIHPEFNEREKIDSVRKTSFTCLALVSKVV